MSRNRFAWVRIASATLLAAIVLVAAPAQAAAPATAAGYRVAGRVVDAVTGDPVRRATVSLLSEEDGQLVAAVVTDAEGHFVFNGIPAGKYPFTAAKRGYRTAYYDEHDEFNSAMVTGEGQETGNIVFQLAPSALVRGVVTGDGGDPVEGASVMLFKRASSDAPGGHVQQVGNTQTDDTGAYEFPNLSPGDYMLAVKAEPWYAQHGSRISGQTREPSPLDVAFPVTFFDSTTDEASATPITLTAGSREQADINLHAVPALRFKVDALSSPHKEPARVTLRQKVFGMTVNSETMVMPPSASGSNELTGVAPGNYDVEIGDPPRVMSLNATSNLDLNANAAVPTLSVAGTLSMAGGGPVPDMVALTLVSVGDGLEPQQEQALKGHFQFDSVPPGTWMLQAGAAGGTLSVVATSAAGVVSPGGQIVLRDRPLSIGVTFSLAQTRIQGFARKDGKAASGVMVVLVPREAGAYLALMRRDQSDSDGSFSLRDVAPGQYTVVAIDDGWKLDWQRREVIARYLPGGQPVTIREQSGPVVSLAKPVTAAAR
ncbi:MAG TPA: carboxypeptidase-like regulatory domain-containing protein [Terracidiphilus sp.]|jgi:protocatechuate 3,4-dioxygenase beta subunit|nr:carboxypeptidase-like regulatory domain-containing protein [Terracidiphilus sp.]